MGTSDDGVTGPVARWLTDCLDRDIDPEAIEIDRPFRAAGQTRPG
jgi:hypothetical protein